jgi:DNA-binding PadR family transcriptional regulator
MKAKATPLNLTDIYVMLAILALPYNKSTGYDVIREIDSRTREAWHFDKVYSSIRKLKKLQFIKPTAFVRSATRDKVCFLLTAPGRTTLKNALLNLDRMRMGTGY